MIAPAFECQRCGHCCQGRGGIVLTAHDTERLAAAMDMAAADFLARFTEPKSSRPILRCGPDGFCVFFDQGCGVHLARPDICRAWPFFRGNLVDASSWEMIQDYCPGVRAEAGHAEFVRQGLALLASLHAVSHPEDAPVALRDLPWPCPPGKPPPGKPPKDTPPDETPPDETP